MKTFTTYAEKKAKQILNLLQGYTKSIRITAILILLLMGVNNVSAWDIGGNNVIFYYANTGGWTGINMYYWGDGWSSNQSFTQISNTKIYYYKFDHKWTHLSGFKYNQKANDWNKQSSGDITGDFTSSRYWKGNETSSSTTLANLNGTAKVISRISTGGTYTELAKTACVATVSGYTLNNSATSASTTNASTGSASSASIQAAYGSTITYKSNTPTGYTFKGFSTTSSTSLPASLKSSGTTVTASGVGGTANTIYYAYYLIDQYTITYNLNGGTNHANNPASYTIETSTITLQAPTKADYTFEGWYTSNDFSGSKVTQITKGSTGNKTFYAKWTANAEDKYNVTAVATPTAGGVVTPATATPMGVTSGGEITATSNEGYEFTKWSLKSGYGYFGTTGTLNTSTTANTVFRPVNQACTIQATFTEIMHTIRVTSTNASYGTVSPTTVTAGVVTQSGEITAAPEPGYAFAGWSVTQGSGKITLSSTSALTTKVTKALADGTITANFQEKKHNVTISYKSGNTHLQSATTQEVGEAKATNITAPTIPGYTFAGWTLGTGIVKKSADTNVNPISITTNSTGSGYTLTANYEKAKYTLTFGVQGGIGGSVRATVGGNAISSPATFEHGTEITLTATADDKYAFIQWVDGSGASLSTANPYTHTLTATTTIQAVFANTDVLYLKPIDNWKQNNEWYAAYFYKEGTGDNFWVRMKNEDPCGGSVYYKTLIPDGDWTHVIFIRMNGSTTDLKWENKWDQTVDLTIPADGKNCFTNGSKNNDKFTGSWSTHTPTNYDPVVFNVTVPAGTPNCYIIGDWDGWSQFTEMTKVDDTHYTVTMYDVCKNSLHYKYCYGPSWGCQEVKTTANSTQAVDNREYSASDNVVAWVKYCLVGADLGWSWNSSYSFDIAGDMNYVFDKKDYYIKVMSSTGKYYTHNEYNYELHRSHTSVKIPYEGGENNELIFKADMQGNYHFQFDPVSKQLTIEFPEKGYQLKIKMSDEKTVYTSNAVDNAGDIFSFFAPGTTDNTLRGTVELYLNGNKQCTIPAVSFDTSRVYVAKLNSARNGIDNIAPYTGNYYIRTDGANGGWNNYKTNADSKMTYFVPREKEKYSYYWVAALPQADRNESNGVVNVKACVANEYNENLAVMLGGDKFTDGNGNVAIKDPSEQKREKINVRFGYNPKTNHFERAMLTGSGNMPNFLNITDPDGCVFKDKNLTTALTEANSDSKFTDVSNWVYETNVWVQPDMTNGATVRLTATAYNDSINSLLGFEADGVTPKQDTIIGKSSGEKREMRIVYDFKTNRMIMAWIPGDSTISDQEALHADVLFIRHENDDVPQLKITSNGKIEDIQSQFFALELENDANNGGNQEHHYWISLPFDCVVGSISGVPGYMEIWGIQRYNGKKRAEKGWFKEDYTFWEWLTPNDTLKAGEGYVLSFDKKAATWNTYDVHEKDENGNTISTTQKSLLRLYFPSTKTGYLFQENMNLTTTYDNQPCKITRENRHKQDGNWKIIATTSYYNAQVSSADTIVVDEDADDYPYYYRKYPNFRYKYTYDNSDMNKRTWQYIPEPGDEGVEYKSFHSYMVQYAGTITWKALNESVMPAGLAARRNSKLKATNITTRLVIADAEEVQHDQTFVALDEKGTTTFDQNLDLNKIFNSGKANVYTLSEGIPFAGNTLPMEEVIVPVGVQIATDGEYTFAMPDGTEGMVVELIDYELETTTNLLLFDYTVTLPKGTNEGRFALHIQPSKSGVTTGVEGAYPQPLPEGKGTKFLIDGKLIIRTAEGEVFDAQGHRL